MIDYSSGINQGDRLVEFQEASNGRMMIADMDDSLKIGDFGPATICGDADGNGNVTISDAVYLITYIFAGGPASNPTNSADVDSNGLATISDAVYLITYIFSGGPAPCAQ